MLTKEKKQSRDQLQMLRIEDIVPEDHILRDIGGAVSFEFIDDEVKDMYSEGVAQCAFIVD